MKKINGAGWVYNTKKKCMTQGMVPVRREGKIVGKSGGEDKKK
jgi:hypothetical protein